MPAGIIETKAILSADDRLTPVIDRIAKSIKGFEASAKVSVQVDQMTKSLSLQRDQLQAIERLERTRIGLAAKGAQVDAAKRALEEAKALGMTAKAMGLLEKDVIRANRAFERQAGFLAGAEEGAKKLAIATGDLSGQEASLRRQINETTAAIERQARAEQSAASRREHLRRTAGAAAAAGGYVVGRGLERAVESGADFGAALNRVRNVSNSESEVALARDLATKASAAYPYTTRTQSVQDYVELRSLAVSDKPGQAINKDLMGRNVGLMAEARAALASSGYALEPGDAKALAQAIEGSGRAMDPTAQRKMLDAYVRAKQVFGEAISASMVRDFVQNAKSANFSMADDAFFRTVMTRLAQGNASRLGNEFAQTMQTITGGHMTKAGAEWLASIGLIRQDQIRKGGGGKFYIAGQIKGQDLLSTDQTMWAQSVLLDAIQHHSHALDPKAIASREKALRGAELRAHPGAQIDEHTLEERAVHGLIADYLSKSGFRTTVTDNLAHAIANAYLTTKDTEQLNVATGLRAAGTIQQNTPAAYQELANAVSSLAGAAAAPGADRAGAVLHAVAGGIGSLTASLENWQKEHPALAETGSWAGIIGAGAASLWGAAKTWGLVTGGFGLGASATALDGSAKMLSEAAVKLGASPRNLAGGTPPVAGGAPGAAGGFWAGLLKFGTYFGVGMAINDELTMNPQKYPYLTDKPGQGVYKHLLSPGKSVAPLIPDRSIPGSWYDRHYGKALPSAASTERTYGSGLNLADVPMAGALSNYALSRRYPQGGYELGGALDGKIEAKLSGKIESFVHVTAGPGLQVETHTRTSGDVGDLGTSMTGAVGGSSVY